MNNRRSTRFITWKDQTQTITVWAALLGHNSSWLARRISRHGLDKAMEPFERLGNIICPHCGESFLSEHFTIDTNTPLGVM